MTHDPDSRDADRVLTRLENRLAGEPGQRKPGFPVVSFGSFRLYPAQRALEKHGVPLILGSRALDILIELTSRAGEIVSSRDLIASVWRGLVVEPGNLRVHVTGLRKALADGEQKARYIVNVRGQGYSFVAPVEREVYARPPSEPAAYPCGAARKRLILPPVLYRMVGRADTVRRISDDLLEARFVSLIGPGGVGKTTVAKAVAHAMRESFADAVCFVDVAVVTNPELVATTIASTLGLTIQSDDAVPTLLECLKSLRVLLVLDNCEHVIDAVATLAEQIFKQVPGAHILITSREGLRVEGECIHWLPPLDIPPPNSRMKALDVQRFPAVRLFMERAGAAGSRFELDDSNAPVVAEICGRLDGLALAIELVAARVGSHGITATAKLLAAGLGLDWHGRRTAHPRHQTLRELLDWSYGSLGQMEQRMLRRLSVFVGPFSIDAMRAVAGGNESEEAQVILAFDDLVAKSLVSVTIADDSTTRYSLLETTRVYACEKLDESGERARAARLHAAYYTSLLETACGGEVEPHPDSRATSLAEHLGNVRVALDWCLGGLEFTNPRHVEVGEVGTATGRPEKTAANDAALGVQLTAAAIPLFMEFSLLNECHKRCTVALEFLDDTARDTRLEMLLQEARAITSAWTLRNGEYVHDAIAKSLCIAVQLGETAHHLRLLVGLHIFLIRAGKFRDSRAVAEHLDALASDHRDDAYRIMSDWMRGSSEHFIGNQAAAQQYLRRGFARPGPRNVQSFGLDYRVRALVTYARVLWLSGAPDRAMVIAREAIDQAAEESRPVNVCFALLYTAPVFLWCGAYDDAKDVLKSLKQHPNWNALPSFHATGLALEGELLVRLGELDRGIAQMTRALKLMKLDQQNVLVSHVAYSLAESLAVAGRFEEAHSVVCAALAESADDGDTAELAELLRIKGAMLFERTGYANMEAEDCLQQSLSCARRQFAASWELRTAITLARVRAKQGRSQEARNVLSSVYNRFTEGFDAPDQKVARILLSELN